MTRGLKHFAVLSVLSGLLFSPLLYAAGDTSIANLQVSGMVPVYFQVIANTINAYLDLTPKVVVSKRAIGMIHFKYNENVQSITVSSSTASGAPENSSNVAYSFGGSNGFQVSFRSGCQSIDTTYNAPFTLTNAGTDVKSVLSTSLTTFGIEEDCELDASYTGTSVNLPMAGFYNMNVTITMLSQ